MTDREYERDRKRLEQQRAVAVLGMTAALSLVKFKEKNADRARNAVSTIIDKMQHEKTYKGKAKKVSLLKQKLENQPSTYVSFSESDRVVEATAKRFIIEWEVLSSKNYGQREDVLDGISSRIRSEGPAKALLSFASDYTTAVYRLESLDKRRDEEAKEEAEAKRKEEERKRQEEERKRQYEARRSSSSYDYEETPRYSTRRSTSSSLYDDEETPRYSTRHSTSSSLYDDEETPRYSTRRSTSSTYPRPETTPSEPKPKPGPNDPVSVEYIQSEIESNVQRGHEYLDFTLRRQIEKTYKKLDQTDYYGIFYEPENIEAIYRFHVMSTNTGNNFSTLYYNKIVDMGNLAVDIVFKDLMEGRAYSSSNMAKFMSQFNPHDTLENYKKARTAYLKYYNRLNAKEKQAIDEHAAKYDDYRKKFGIMGKAGDDIATVDDIIRVVNRKVREEYIKERRYMLFINEYNEVRFDNISHFYEALKYMNIEEIASLYSAIIIDRESQSIYARSDEEYERIAQAREKCNASLQRMFAEAIRRRLTNTTYSIEEINDETKTEERMKKVETDLVAICKDYFHEEPRFDLHYIKVGDVKEGYGEARVQTAETIAAAKRRYYGMGKLQQVLGTLNFRKLKALGMRDTLTSEELERVKSMF